MANTALQALIAKQQGKYKQNSGDTLRPKEGRNQYRIIAPSADDAEWVKSGGGKWWADQGVHWLKQSEDGKPVVVVGDSDICFDEPSDVNTAIEIALASPSLTEDDKKLYRSWRARHSVLINVIDRSSNKVEVLELTKTTFGNILDLYGMYADAGQDITDPIEGSDIVITRSGKGLNTEYSVVIAPAKGDPVKKEQIAQATDLPKLIREKYFRGEEVKAIRFVQQISGVPMPANILPAGVNAPLALPTVATTAVAPPVFALQSAAVVAPGAVVSPNADLEARRQELLAQKAKLDVANAQAAAEAQAAAVAQAKAEAERKAAEEAALLASLEPAPAATTTLSNEDQMAKLMAELAAMEQSGQ